MASPRKKSNEVHFSRWDNNRKISSWAFKVFKKQNTEMYRMYWNFISSNSYTKYLLKKDVTENTDFDLWEFLHVDNNGKCNVPNDYEEWRKNNTGFNSWVRLNILLTLVSNFEMYISNIINVSLESNPGLLLGKTNKIDGIVFLKNNMFDEKLIKEHKNKLVNATTKGTWYQRIHAMKLYLGNIPLKFDDKAENLEKIRAIRNNVAHSFGRNLDEAQENRSTMMLEPISISEERLIEYSGDLFHLAKELDSFLMKEHIGAFEDLYFYHTKIAKKNSVITYNGLLMQELKKESYIDCGLRSKNYLEQLIRYYYDNDKTEISSSFYGYKLTAITMNNIDSIVEFRNESDKEKWLQNNGRILREFGLNYRAIVNKKDVIGYIGFNGVIKPKKIKGGKTRFVTRMNFDYKNLGLERTDLKNIISEYLNEIIKLYPYFTFYYQNKRVNNIEEQIISQI